jgi:3-hydroxyisobutyrate dehydrogenase-like beta-hydroxyacid dehydrogenase
VSKLIGVLHPGEMGVSVAQALVDSGHQACWLNEGRSAATQQRAARFTAYASLPELLDAVEAVISVCPPHAALDQAREVQACGFAGTYVDANAVAPTTAAEIGAVIGEGFVDGGIVGPPAHKPGTPARHKSPAGSPLVLWR